MPSPFTQIQFYIAIEDDLLPEEVERLEDSLAYVLQSMDLHGELESESTGNTTVFPSKHLKGNLDFLLKMLRRMVDTRYVHQGR